MGRGLQTKWRSSSALRLLDTGAMLVTVTRYRCTVVIQPAEEFGQGQLAVC